MAGNKRLIEATEEREEVREEAKDEQPAQSESFFKNTIHKFKINQLTYGYCVEVGCHTIAIESKETLIRVLTDYINDPSSTEKKFREGKLFSAQVLK